MLRQERKVNKKALLTDYLCPEILQIYSFWKPNLNDFNVTSFTIDC